MVPVLLDRSRKVKERVRKEHDGLSTPGVVVARTAALWQVELVWNVYRPVLTKVTGGQTKSQ
jgi:hypothetical protein